MEQKRICLASDNWAPVHPIVMQAISEANLDFAPPYGSDPWTEEAQNVIQQAFEKECRVFFVPTGTGANVFALKLACRSHESVICSDIAHIQYQESGAAEALIGCKLLCVPHKEGKVTSEDVIAKLKSERAFGKHSTFPRILSISQPTEVGTVYSLEELDMLSKVCKDEKLLLHIDGSRLYNAVVSLGISFKQLVDASCVDILSLGGTKNGLMGAEALLIFNKNLEEGSDFLQKQTLQMPSKMRYLSAQYISFFKNGLWRSLALQANQKAKEIEAIVRKFSYLSLSYPVQTNQLFFTCPAAWIPLFREQVLCYPWDQQKNELRCIASWNTSEQDVVDLRAIMGKIS